MNRKFRQNLILLLASFLIAVAGIEIYLWHADPYGLRLYLMDFRALTSHRTSHPTGTQYHVGHHELGGYSFTALPDGLRLVPDTGRSECIITAIGDSVTFGMGVDDHETWVNLLAQRYPDVQFLNAGRPTYSVSNVLASYNYYDESDAFIYIVIDDDDGEFLRHQYNSPPPHIFAIQIYMYFWVYPAKSPFNMDNFMKDFVPLLQKDNILIIDFELDRLVLGDFADQYPSLRPVPMYTQVISRADPHPTPAGHIEIADNLEALVGELIEKNCGAEYLP